MKAGACIDYISRDLECETTTAIRDFPEILRSRLLVFRLPERRPSGLRHDEIVDNIAVINTDARDPPPAHGPSRATARAFFNALSDMIGKGEHNKKY